MTTETKPDWADEIAGKLAYGLGVEEIARALRKAKADGVRQVVDLMMGPFCHVLISQLPDEIKNYADRIERGEP